MTILPCPVGIYLGKACSCGGSYTSLGSGVVGSAATSSCISHRLLYNDNKCIDCSLLDFALLFDLYLGYAGSFLKNAQCFEGKKGMLRF